MKDILIRECMRSPAVTIGPETTFQEALTLLENSRQRHIVVTNNQQEILGIVTEVDLKYACPSSASTLSRRELYYWLSNIAVRELMTEKVVTITPEATIKKAAGLMLKNEISGLPVVDRNQCVTGIVTLLDILLAVFGCWPKRQDTLSEAS